MQIGTIVQGHVNEFLGLNKNLSEERMKICKVCPIYSNKLGGICNRKLWLNPNTNKISLEEKDGFIRGCGCRLNAKTTVLEEHCPAKKW